MTRKIKLERHGQDGWFFATVEGADGLLSFGPTKEETLKRLEVATKLWLRARADSVQIRDHGWRPAESGHVIAA